jgi:hypothetical protein
MLDFGFSKKTQRLGSFHEITSKDPAVLEKVGSLTSRFFFFGKTAFTYHTWFSDFWEMWLYWYVIYIDFVVIQKIK